jgi:hypothetical protein
MNNLQSTYSDIQNLQNKRCGKGKCLNRMGQNRNFPTQRNSTAAGAAFYSSFLNEDCPGVQSPRRLFLLHRRLFCNALVGYSLPGEDALFVETAEHLASAVAVDQVTRALVGALLIDVRVGPGELSVLKGNGPLAIDDLFRAQPAFQFLNRQQVKWIREEAIRN